MKNRTAAIDGHSPKVIHFTPMEANDRSAELDAYAQRLNAAHRAAVEARDAAKKADTADGVVLHAEIVPPVCQRCGGMERTPRPDNCPNCFVRFFG